MINWGTVPLGAVLPFHFTTYGKTNGESITLTGLAVTDIEIYKGTTVTQRSSDAGYALIDTDGIDIDGITGLHGFSVDTGDNTDAGFFVAGSYYIVVVSAVTIDSQTVNFIAGTFSLRAAESVAGVIEADVTHNAGTAITAAAGIQEVKVASLANNAITAASINADAITAAKIADGAIDANTFAAGAITASAIAADAIGASELAADAVAEIADAVWDEATTSHTTSGTFGEQLKTDVDAILADTGTDGVIVASLAANSITASVIADGAIDAGAIAADAITAAKIATGAIDADALAADAAAEITTAVLTTAMTEAYAADGAAPTLAQALFAIQQFLQERSVSSTTLTVKKLDGSTSAMTFTLNDASAPTSITRAS